MSRFHKSYYEEIQGKWLVWNWSTKYRRYVNTHMYDNKLDAVLTVRAKR